MRDNSFVFLLCYKHILFCYIYGFSSSQDVGDDTYIGENHFNIDCGDKAATLEMSRMNVVEEYTQRHFSEYTIYADVLK